MKLNDQLKKILWTKSIAIFGTNVEEVLGDIFKPNLKLYFQLIITQRVLLLVRLWYIVLGNRLGIEG